MPRVNPYAVLGLQPSASDWAIRRTYKRLIRECHPDVTDDPAAHERAREINAAYAILGDPERRAAFESNLGNILEGWTNLRPLFWVRTRHCLQCGVEIHYSGTDASYSPTYRSKRSDAAYCSNACRQAAYRARKAAMEAARKQLGAGPTSES